MYTVVGLNEEDILKAERFVDALKLFHEHCIESIAREEKPRNTEMTCYIEAQ
jgi:hypothetical protein